MKRIALFVLLVCFTVSPLYAAQESPATGLFVSLVQDPPVLSSKNEILKLIQFLKEHHIKTLFVQVYRANQAWFPSRLADTKDYQKALKTISDDPLRMLIEEAHRHDIEVHAWLNVLSLATNTKAPILKKYGPGILTKNNQVKRRLEDYKIDDQYFLEPSDLRVQKHLLGLISDLVRHYPKLDGIQLDYIRYPDVHPDYGYSTDNMQKFKLKTGRKRITAQDELWKQWKRDQVTSVVKQLAQKARQIHPGIKVSTTGCVSYARALEEAFQDWPKWVNEGVVDFVTIMNYPIETAEFKKHIDEIKGKVQHLNKVNIGVGAYKPEMTFLEFQKQFTICQASQSGDCVIFHYENLVDRPGFKKVLDLK